MTRVFITRTGAKYHASVACPSFDSAEKEHGRPIERFARDLKGLSHDSCSVCWPLEHGYEAWRQLELEVERTGDSPYEALFVGKVLRAVPGVERHVG